MATFHVLPGGQPAVAVLARRVQEALSGVPALEPLATKDLHLTLQGVAFVDELEDTALDAVTRQAAARLIEIASFTAVLGPAEVGAEGAWLPAEPGGRLRRRGGRAPPGHLRRARPTPAARRRPDLAARQCRLRQRAQAI
jgi:hypothetical protein